MGWLARPRECTKLTVQSVTGLVDDVNYETCNTWWDTASLDAMEKLLPSTHTTAFQTKARAGPKKGSPPSREEWLRYTAELFEAMEAATPDRDPLPKPLPVVKSAAGRLAHDAAAGEGRQTRSRGVTPQASPVKREAKEAIDARPILPEVTPTAPTVELITAPKGASSEQRSAETVAVKKEDVPAESSIPAPRIRFTFKAGETAKTHLAG